jgi:DNA-binding transcriptional LysR family regulator
MVGSVFDPITLDQLRAFVAVVEEGSFSAAARKLKRVQSAISTAMSNLEDQLGVPIWDRSTKIATLTEQGQAVLAAARRVLLEVDALRRTTAGLAMGVEGSVSLVVDALFPVSALVDLCTGFAKEFPAVDLRVDTQVMSIVAARIMDGSATLGVAGPFGVVTGLERKVLARIQMMPVTGPRHPLASVRGPISASRLGSAVQVVLSERTDPAERGVADQAVLSPRTWRVADLHTKHALLRASLGWGNLPEHLIRDDLQRGKLVRLQPEGWLVDEGWMTLSAVYRTGAMFGPAHRWVLGHLETLCVRDVGALPRAAKRKAPPKPA